MNNTVTIISICSKIDGIEGQFFGRDKNVEYTVDVPAHEKPEATLEEAFMLTNRDDRPLGKKVCSTSIGDVMVLDGQHYLVDWHGFKALTLEQSQTIQKLTSRDTSFGWNWLVEKNLVQA